MINHKPLKISNSNDLHDYYWLKTELVEFCLNNKISASGSKCDLINRIDIFFSAAGIIPASTVRKNHSVKDSQNKITVSTLVKNYSNDAKTRAFFEDHIGDTFKFNAFLRQFTKKENIKEGMTYGDLVKGWQDFENAKKHSKAIKNIPKQFEYNQFIQDYFKNEKNTTFKKAVLAWQVIKQQKGARTYKAYKKFVRTNNLKI